MSRHLTVEKKNNSVFSLLAWYLWLSYFNLTWLTAVSCNKHLDQNRAALYASHLPLVAFRVGGCAEGVWWWHGWLGPCCPALSSLKQKGGGSRMVRASQPLARAQRPWHRTKASRAHLRATAAPVGRGLPAGMLHFS